MSTLRPVMRPLAVLLLCMAISLSAWSQPAHRKHHVWRHVGHAAATVGKAAVWIAISPLCVVASFLGGTL
jgi:hypothetical protein